MFSLISKSLNSSFSKWNKFLRTFTSSKDFFSHRKEPLYVISDQYPQFCATAEDVVAPIRSDSSIFIHGAGATPFPLINALTEHVRQNSLRNIRTFHIHLEGKTLPFLEPDISSQFLDTSLFAGANVRRAIEDGRADYTPIFLSEIPLLFKRKQIPLDVAMLHVSPPDKHGYCSLGISVDVAKSAASSAKHLIGMLNKQMPRTHGDSFIHISHFDQVLETDNPLPLLTPPPPDEVDTKIAKIIAENLIEDGSTIQVGIGQIPNALLPALKNHRNLGVHTEMFTDGIIDLLEQGVITNSEKYYHPGKLVAGFCIGSKKVYDFVDDNPLCLFAGIDWINNGHVISKNPKPVAVNSAIEIDVTGQVVSDSIGTYVYSGVGGQVDFMRGAALNLEGKPIIALTSRTGSGKSRIVPEIKPGAGVVTTRAHVHYVVTEYGIANLIGKSIRERARELIRISHPDDREYLSQYAQERFKYF